MRSLPVFIFMRMVSAGLLLVIFCINTFAQNIIYVNKAASGLNNGTSWQNAYTDLQPALLAATAGKEIWVAGGSYYPTTSTSRTVSFVLKNDVSLYGGFAGGESSISQRVISVNPTILSGDVGIVGDSTDNSYRVVTASLVNNTTINFNGFIVEKSNGTVPTSALGGGMYTESSDLHISNCTFRNNYASGNGGGLYIANGEVTVTGCTFTGNRASSGGGLYILNVSRPVRNCVFENNIAVVTASSRGGAIFADECDLYTCTFRNNRASAGGALGVNGFGSTVNKCTFDSNYAATAGGAVTILSGAFYIINSSFNGNLLSAATGDGGAIYATLSSSTLSLNNCSFTGNRCLRNGGVLYVNTGKVAFTNCLFNNNYAGNFGGVIYFITGSSSWLKVNSGTFSGNNAGSNGKTIYDYNVTATKSMVNNCVFSGNGTPEIAQQPSTTRITHVTYSLVQTPDTGVGNVTTAPVFINPAGTDGIAGTVDDNLRLLSSSAGINQGNPDTAAYVHLLEDLDGEPRIAYGRMDMGAYENPDCSGTISPAVAGDDTIACSAISALTAVKPLSGVGRWNIISGSATIANFNSHYTQVSNVKNGITLAEWSVKYCGVVLRDTMMITRPPAFSTPSINASGPLTFCSDSSVTLSVPASYGSYLWSTGATTPSIVVTTGGIYSVVVKDSLGCAGQGTQSRTVVVNSIPAAQVITFTGDSILCGSESITLRLPTGFSAYGWSDGSSASSLVVSTTKKSSGRVQDNNGCWSPYSDTVSIVKYANPANPLLTVTDSTVFCEGDSAVISAPPGYTKYAWNTGAQTPAITVYNNATVSVTVTDSNTCKSNTSLSITKTVIPRPTITVTGITMCVYDSVKLTGPASYAVYSWNGLLETTRTITAPAPRSYTLEVADAMGCKSIASLPVVIFDRPATQVISVTGNTRFCQGQSVLLKAPSVFASYKWSDSSVASVLTATAAGSYRLQVKDGNNCKSLFSDPVNVIVNPLPPAPVVSPSGTKTICTGDSVTLAIPAGYSAYQWSNGAVTPAILVLQPGSYRVRATDTSGCTSPFSASTIVQHFPVSPAPVISSDPAKWCRSDSVVLDASGTYPFYFWNNGMQGKQIVLRAAAIVNVYARDMNGCLTPPSADLHAQVQRPAPLIALDASGYPGTDEIADHYHWYHNDQLLETDAAKLLSQQPGRYVLMTEKDGCLSAASNPLLIECSATGATLYPNPGTGEVTLSVSGSQAASAEVTVYNLLGQAVSVRQLNTQHCGRNEYYFDLRSLARGQYMFMVKVNDKWIRSSWLLAK